MKQKTDILNWALLFSAIALTAAFVGAREWTAMCVAENHVPSGSNIFSGLFAIALMFCAGLLCLIASGIYSLLVKRGDAILGFTIAAACALPLMMINSVLVYILWFLLDLVGLKKLPFNPYDLRLVLPLVLIILSFVHRPRVTRQTGDSNQHIETAE